jgi:hypothetical protein
MGSGSAKNHHWIDLVIWLPYRSLKLARVLLSSLPHLWKKNPFFRTLVTSSNWLCLSKSLALSTQNLFEFKVKAIVKLLLETTHLARSGYHRSRVVVTKPV